VRGPAGESEEARGTTLFENFSGNCYLYCPELAYFACSIPLQGLKIGPGELTPPHGDHGKNAKTHFKIFK